ncbi:GNAT family N-acetyltransferase [Anaeromicropila populeti]|uniref:Protein N-acetyltransferase, RimJ/RimL family n=1 Tax=Anaeromicropila populeti TaxID=37658 RepID=A0A1I6ICT0_9FIRM|nr:GNAT family N-acetyltransferase [Anaeromicropila populeti]SFR64542.1 Protein N-acetyltransferase, RimJ/RimL family [Anaeromicropila populeti]
MICRTFESDTLQQYQFVVILSKYNGKILLSRHKERTTWETQGGHIEAGETPLEAANRELYEEAGALEFSIEPMCDYWAGDPDSNQGANGKVFLANIDKLGQIPESEMAEVREFDVLPENLTYTAITPVLFAKIGYYTRKKEICTKRLILEPLGLQHLMSAHAYSGDIENTKYMMYLPNYSVEETKKFLVEAEAEWKKENPDYYEFAILLGGEHIGAVSIYLNQNRTEGELGWIIRKNYWGNGYVAEAAREILTFAKDELGIKRFIAHCDSENTGSYRVMEKLGMHLVSRTKGRKNKASEEEREELKYLLEIK